MNRRYARAQARHDRQTGAMPSQVQRRADGDELWAAFRQAIGGSSWTWRDVRMFMAGWDHAKGHPACAKRQRARRRGEEAVL